jgi:hypothetical protein
MRHTFSTALLLLAMSPSVYAGALDLSLSDEMAEFVLSTDMTSWGFRGGELGAGLLFNEDDDLAGTLRLQSLNRVSNAFTYGVGLKGYGVRLDEADEDFAALAIGGEVDFSLATQLPLTVALNAYIAPDILTSDDAEGLHEVSARLQAGISQMASAFIGYRRLEADMPGDDVEIDDNFHIGIRLGF